MAVLAGVAAPSWALPISEFLENGVLPMDETEARQVQRRASAYSIINNELIKRSSTGVFQRCVESPQRKAVGPNLGGYTQWVRWRAPTKEKMMKRKAERKLKLTKTARSSSCVALTSARAKA